MATFAASSNNASASNMLDEDISSEIEFFLSAKDLPNLDSVRDTSDSYAILYHQDRSQQWVEVGRTETLTDTDNPEWTTQFKAVFHFEEVQTFCVRIYDYDTKRHSDHLGDCTFTLGEVMGYGGGSSGRCTKSLSNVPRSVTKKTGTARLIIQAEEISKNLDVLRGQFKATKLANKDGWFSKSDPFLTLSRENENGSWVRTFSTEVVPNNLNPTWQPFEISVQALCNGDYHRPLLLQVYDHDSDGTHDFIGQKKTSLNELLSNKSAGGAFMPILLVDPKKPKKKPGKVGKVVALSLAIEKNYSLLDYIQGGIELNVVCAIDYTASNGNPHSMGSLHYQSNAGYNAYQNAIYSIGSILEAYDSDKLLPTLGFGARINSTTSHCFSVDENNLTCYGVAGVLEAYRNSFSRSGFKLSGPTIFRQIIDQACQMAESNPNVYTVLLILTDGVICDMQNTVNAIVDATGLPLSIVIVGVGNADFSAMIALDGDDGQLFNSARMKAQRDIVQFVPFNQFSHDPAALARETLAEIPKQLTEYFKMRGIAPAAHQRIPARQDVGKAIVASAPMMPTATAVPLSFSTAATVTTIASRGKILLRKSFAK